MNRVAFAVLAAVSAAPLAPADSYSLDDLTRRTIERRAVEAVIWGMPAVNYELMYQEMLRLGGKPNQIVYWSGLLDWRNQTLTPNPDVIYLMPFFNTKDGPVVIEIPAAGDGVINGSIMDPWQAALEDVGPAGVDKGAGGKYLILPPDYKEKVPDGYTVLPSANYHGYALLRSILKSGSEADVKAAVAYGKRIKLYPLRQAANHPETVFLDAKDAVYDSTIPYDLRFFQSLDRFVQNEPWLTRDKAMIDQLKSIGIEKGKPFSPDAATQAILNASAGEARAWLDLKYETAFSPYYEGRQWTFPILPEVIEGLQSQFATPGSYPVDGRGVTYTMAFFSTKHSGIGQFYLMTIKDKAAQPFEGGSTYRLSVPVNVPVKQYWSATVYDRATHGFTREMHRAGRSSQSPGLQTNADGSVDIWFGPKSPVGKESNWIPTKPGGKCEVLFRFYGPEKSVFDKTWMLPDIELVAATDTAQTPLPSTATGVIPVTPDNFNRAETDTYFGGSVKTAGVGKFHHFREPTPLDQQNVIRMNRDTLYSLSVFDLDAGPVTITLPDAGQRFISLQVIDQDQYTPEVIYAPGSYTFTRDRVGTRYVTLGVRILANPADPQDLKQVHALQDAITVTQPGGPGRFEVPSWDQVSQKKVRDALLALAKTLPDTKRTFGPRDQVDPVRHLIGTAFAFGGNPEKDALYLNITPSKNDGATVHRLTVKDVPVDAFWSISVYNADGYFEKNPYNAYTLNGLTAKKNADGSFPIQFGACDGKILNCLPTMPGWNYMVRLYRPRAEILNGTWKFPEALPMEAGSRALQ